MCIVADTARRLGCTEAQVFNSADEEGGLELYLDFVRTNIVPKKIEDWCLNIWKKQERPPKAMNLLDVPILRDSLFQRMVELETGEG